MNQTVQIIAWGVRHGPMPVADLKYDLRHLKNPHRDRSLRYLTGLDEKVQKEVFRKKLSHTTFANCLKDVWVMLSIKNDLVIVFACTGGKHRSVAFAERMAVELEELGVTVTKEYPFINTR